jgi:hypothetical protein
MYRRWGASSRTPSKERREQLRDLAFDGGRFSPPVIADLILPHLAVDPSPEDAALADLLALALGRYLTTKE